VTATEEAERGAESAPGRLLGPIVYLVAVEVGKLLDRHARRQQPALAGQ
jgi:hypothetical protein